MKRIALVTAAILLVAWLTILFVPRGDEGAESGTDGVTAGAEEASGTNAERAARRAPGGEDDPLERAIDEGVEIDWADIPEAPEETWPGSMSLRVVSAQDGAPIEGAHVRVDLDDEADREKPGDPLFHERTTDRDGHAELPFRRYSCTWFVRKPAHRTVWPEYDDDLDPFEVRLEPAAMLRGRVTHAATGAPIEGAGVASWPEKYDFYVLDVNQTTDENGEFVIAGAPGDQKAFLAARYPGLGSVTTSLTPAEHGERIEIVLGRGAEVTGTVSDADGGPVGNADVFVAARGGDFPLRPATGLQERARRDEFLRARTTTDATGRYVIGGLQAPGSYIVFARSLAGAEGQSNAFEATAPGDRHVADIAVHALGALALRYVDRATGERVVPEYCKATIDEEDWTQARDDQKGGEDDDGVSHFADVRAGKHVVFLWVRGFLETKREVVVGSGDETVVEIPLDRGVKLSGRLLDGNGEPVAMSLHFSCHADGVDHYASGKSGDDGYFVVEPVPRAAGELSVYRDGTEVALFENVIAGKDLGDLVVKRPPRVIGRIAKADLEHEFGPGVDGRWVGGNLHVDEEGRFEITGIPIGETVDVFLEVGDVFGSKRSPPPPIVIRGIKLADGETLDLGEVRLPKRRVVKGLIRNEDGSPLAYAQVRVAELWGSRHVRTDADGRFSIDTLPPGKSTLLFEVDDLARAHRVVDVKDGMAPLEVIAPRVGTLDCRVTTAAGAPASSMAMDVFPVDSAGKANWGRRVIVHTNSTGRFRGHLTPGRYRVRVRAGEIDVDEAPAFTVIADETVRLDIVLE